jgi:NAD(P)-dependent dehydrogenase (short-subunit alcohol dehydrogenase family)
MGRLEGKVALVTGAGRGLGRAIAIGFAAEGAKVALLSRGREALDGAVADVVAAGGTAIGIHCDVFDLDRVDQAVAQVAEAFGTVDILVNNSWDQGSALSPILELEPDQLRRQFESGPIVYLRFMQACFPHMDGRDGRIINLASCVGVASHPGRAPYAIAKEGVRALTRTAAREWGPRRVTVNCLLPVTDTDSFREDQARPGARTPVPPIPRIGDPAQDVVPVALFLANPEAGYITGYSYFADGGLMIDAGR